MDTDQEIKGEDVTTSAISTNICKTHEFNDAVFYHAMCGCGSTHHEQSLCMEYDEEIGDLTLIFYHNNEIKYLDRDNYFRELYFRTDNCFVSKFALVGWWFSDIWNRLKLCCEIMMTGEVKFQSVYMIQSKDHINSYLNALHEAADKISSRHGL